MRQLSCWIAFHNALITWTLALINFSFRIPSLNCIWTSFSASLNDDTPENPFSIRIQSWVLLPIPVDVKFKYISLVVTSHKTISRGIECRMKKPHISSWSWKRICYVMCNFKNCSTINQTGRCNNYSRSFNRSTRVPPFLGDKIQEFSRCFFIISKVTIK